MLPLRGAYAPIPTPFEKDEIAFDKLTVNLEVWGRSSLDGLVVLGTNGEAVFLDHEEKIALIKHVRENFPAEKPVVAGTGCESARETLKLTDAAASAGADAALVITPHFYKGGMQEANLKAFYNEVADHSPIPVVLYNMPRNTGLNLPAKLVTELSYHENIVSVKDSSGDIVQISEITAHCHEDFSVFAGSAGFLLPSLIMGAVGGTMAVANIIPEHCSDIFKYFREGRLHEAQSLQQRILPLNKAVTAGFGVAGLKAAMDMLGYYYGGNPRLPLLPLDENQKEELKGIMQKAEVIN